MKSPLRILHLEDSPQDAELVKAALSGEGVSCEILLADSRERYMAALDQGGFDLILADYSVASFDGLSALRIAKEKRPETPFILVSGALGEEAAIECLKLGATDYVLKQHLSRLVPCMRRALQEAEVLKAHKLAEAQLRLQSAALRAAGNAIVITDRQGHIVWVNPAFSKLTGYSSQEAIGQNPRLLKSRMHDQRFYQDLWKTILSGEVWSGEIVNRRKDGTLYTEEQSITPVKNDEGTISHFIAIKQDITERKRAEEALHDRTRIAEFTSDISAALAGGESLQAMLQKCVEAMVQHLGAAFAHIWTLNLGENTLELRASAGMCVCVDGAHSKIPVGQFKIGLIAHERRPYLTNTLAGEPGGHGQGWAQQEGLVSFAGYPLLIEKRVLGVMAMSGRQPISARIFDMLSTIANEIAVGVERKLSGERERRHSERIRALHEIDRVITSTLDLPSVLSVVMKIVEQFFSNVAGVGIGLVNHETGLIEPVAASGMPLKEWKQAFFPAGRSFINVDALNGPLFIPDLRASTQDQPEQRAFTDKYGQASMLVVPIQIADRTLGMLGFGTKVKYEFSTSEIEFIVTLAGQAAVAIQNADLYGRSKRQAAELIEQERIQRVLKELSLDITRMNVDELLEKITAIIRDIFNVDVADVRFLGKTRWQKVVISSEAGVEWPPGGGSFGEGATLWVANHRRSLAIRDYTEQKEFAPGRVVKQFGVHGFIAAPLIAKSGNVIGIIRAMSKRPRDFTAEEIELFEQLAHGAAVAIENEQLYVNLQKSDKAKSEFLSVMSHELRTPLNVIMGYANLLKDDLVRETDAPHRQALQIIEHHANSLLGVINSVMDASGIESGNVAVHKDEVYLADLFEQLKTMCSLPKEKNIALVWELPDGLPYLMTDHEKLGRILKNLIDNAIKFTETGTITVSARLAKGKQQSAKRTASGAASRDTNDDIRNAPDQSAVRNPQSAIESRAIEFIVQDTGIGIAAQTLPSIFEMFKQGDSSNTRGYEGAGLGLYIVKKYCDLLGADISVESIEGKGSTFTVTVPCAVAATETGGPSDKRCTDQRKSPFCKGRFRGIF